MMKLIFCASVCLGACNSVIAFNSSSSIGLSAQTAYFEQYSPYKEYTGGDCLANNETTSQVPAINLGVKAGFNFSNTDFSKGHPAPTVPIETLWRTGFVLGVSLEVPIHKRIYIQQDYLYSQMRGEIESSGVVYNFKYISLPVLLKYKINNRVALAAGPQFDLLVQAQETVDGNKLDITHDMEERSIGATAGVELMLLKKVSLEARYMHGINHIGITQQHFSSEFKYKLLQLTARVRLPPY